MPFDFAHPAALALLPLILLPLLRRQKDALAFSHLPWLPVDRRGRWLGALWRASAVLGLTCIVLGLAGPGHLGAQVLRSGRGAEVLILFDRSSSMDAIITPKGVLAAGSLSAGESKNKVARDLLTQFVTRRPHDRFALMTFSTSVMRVAPFTDHNQAVMAGLAAAGVGRGLPNTDMGAGLLAAIDEFRQRSYSGSRVILIVSDGGAQLDEATRQRIRDGLSRNRIGLYFIYIRSSVNSPNLAGETAGASGSTEAGSTDEAVLHRFFLSLPTPYRLFQADESKAMAAALAEIDRQQNLPLTTIERLPRQDDSGRFYFAALLACGLLLACHSVRLRSWT